MLRTQADPGNEDDEVTAHQQEGGPRQAAMVTMRELEALDTQSLRDMANRCIAENRVDELATNLARLVPESFHDHLDHIDPSDALAPAFERAPWAAVRHWAEELTLNPSGVPALDNQRPADALAAALCVLGRCGHQAAFQHLERWLTWARGEQISAARQVLATVGIAITPGRRVMQLWRRPAWQLIADPNGGDTILGQARELSRSCDRCHHALVVVLDINAEIVPDLAIDGPRLQATVCPSCIAQGQVSYGRPRGTRAPHPKRTSETSKRAPEATLCLPAWGSLRAAETSVWGDPTREDRRALFRLGGAPTHYNPHTAWPSTPQGAPMLFLAQVPLERSMISLWYSSEERLVAGILAKEPFCPQLLRLDL